MKIALYIATAARFALGLLFLYAALLLHEDEEGKIQNALETWTLKAMYRRDSSLSKTTAFLQGLARLVDLAFNKVFGKRLWSMDAVYSSFCLTLASGYLFNYLSAYLDEGVIRHFQRHWAMRLYRAEMIQNAFIVGILVAGALLRNRYAKLIAMFGSFAAMTAFTFWAFRGSKVYVPNYGDVLDLGAAYGISFLSDIIFIIATRFLLRKASSSPSSAKIVLVGLSNVLLAILFMLAPIFLLKLATHPAAADSRFGRFANRYIADMLYNVFFANRFDTILCFAIALLCVLVVLQMIFWPLLERCLYSMQRYEVINNKKLLWSSAVVLCFGPTFLELSKTVVTNVQKWGH